MMQLMGRVGIATIAILNIPPGTGILTLPLLFVMFSSLQLTVAGNGSKRKSRRLRLKLKPL